MLVCGGIIELFRVCVVYLDGKWNMEGMRDGKENDEQSGSSECYIRLKESEWLMRKRVWGRPSNLCESRRQGWAHPGATAKGKWVTLA